LPLVREKPSYGAEIGRRFEERYGGLLGSRAHHAHRSVKALERQGLIEPYRTTRGTNRQPRVHFRITDAGVTELQDWLGSPLLAGSADQEMAVRMLSVPDGDRESMRRVLEVYKLAMLAAASEHELDDDSDEPMGAWFRELERVETAAAIDWSAWAQRQLDGATA
jgi:DNA-binding PadR family transcriptional regulator